MKLLLYQQEALRLKANSWDNPKCRSFIQVISVWNKNGLGSMNAPYISGYFKVCKEDKLADPQMYLNEPVLNMTASLVLHLKCLFQGSCLYF